VSEDLTKKTGLSATGRRLRAREAGLISAARCPDIAARAAKARAGTLARFLREVDEQWPGLQDGERNRKALLLQRAHLARMSRLSAQSRTRTKKAKSKSNAS
jgi:hypothetical protein